MYHVDIAKVRGKMAEQGYNITSFAERIGVNRNTMSSYLRDPSGIPYEVLDLMADSLCESYEEASPIFFASDLR